jgi:hypothetical protein
MANKIFIAIVLALTLPLSSCMVGPPPTWQTVKDKKLALELLDQNGRDLLKVPELTKLQSNIRSITLTPKSAPSLTIYNFNTKRLCGVGGCLNSIYLTSTNRLLFKILLNKKANISIEDKCLVFSQKNQNNTSSVKYCYQGNSYVQQPVTTSSN